MPNKIQFNKTDVALEKGVIDNLERVLKLIRPDVTEEADSIVITERNNKYIISNTQYKSTSSGFTR